MNLMDLVLLNWKERLSDLEILKKNLKLTEVEELSLRRHAERSLISRALLKSFLSERLNSDAQHLELKTSENGKLYLLSGQYQFSLAHSGDLMAFVFHPKHRVGVDLETWDRAEQILRFAPRYFKPRENSYIEKDTLQTKERALQIWTSKEAWLKAEGSTVFSALEHREIPINLRNQVESTDQVRFDYQTKPEEYYLSVATLS